MAKTNDFAEYLYKHVVCENQHIYKEAFESAIVEDQTDHYWKEALRLYNNLDRSQKRILFSILKQVQIDTISSLLAVLDGVTIPESLQNDEIGISIGGDRVEGYLQDSFLELIEDNRDSLA